SSARRFILNSAVEVNEKKENRRWTTMDDDEFHCRIHPAGGGLTPCNRLFICVHGRLSAVQLPFFSSYLVTATLPCHGCSASEQNQGTNLTTHHNNQFDIDYPERDSRDVHDFIGWCACSDQHFLFGPGRLEALPYLTNGRNDRD